MTRDAAGYADLGDYAAIGDGRTVALIAADGRVDWLPLPDIDSPPAFAALLDAEHGGVLELAPVDEHTVERGYIEGTNVLRTVYTTRDGSVSVTDSLNTGVAGRLPWAEFARRIDGLTGSVRLRARAAPGTLLNSASPYCQQTEHGPVLRVDDLTMAVRTLDEATRHDDERGCAAEFVTAPGSRQLFALVATEAEPLFLPPPDVIAAGVDRTVENWRTWSATFSWDGPWDDAVRRSALALKLLVQAPSGSMAAAATTSLPESMAGGRNWDYRLAWVRDTAYSLQALYRFGLREETHAAISWLLATVRRGDAEPRVLYRLDGQEPDGTHEHDVPGWRGVGPVVTGNRAAGQLQLGVYGDLFTIVQLYVDQGNVLDARTGRALAELADITCDRWRSRDSGMWETEPARHHVASKMGCWQALVNAVHLAEIGQLPGDPSRWRSESELIRSWIDEHGWDEERGTYLAHPGSSDLDAAVLLHAISGYDRGPRMSSTIDALRRELGDGPWLYRFTGADDVEASFVACAFWSVSALYLVGREDEAVALMDELVGSIGELGVLAEMVVPATGEYLGNLPQALSHLALVNAAITCAGG